MRNCLWLLPEFIGAELGGVELRMVISRWIREWTSRCQGQLCDLLVEQNIVQVK